MNNPAETIETLSQANDIKLGYEYKLDQAFPGLLLRCELCDCVVPVRHVDDAFVCRVCETAWGVELRRTINATRGGSDISEERFWCSLANGILDELTGRINGGMVLLESVLDNSTTETDCDEPDQAE